MDKLSPEELARCFKAAIEHKRPSTTMSEVNTTKSKDERVQWIRETALAMNETMGKKCEEFDALHPNDKFLASDCVNSAVTLLSWILKATGRKITNLEIGPINDPNPT